MAPATRRPAGIVAARTRELAEKGSPAGRATAAQRGYGRRWQKCREGHLRANPLCEFCLKLGRTVAASVVDHVRPHRGDQKLFWDPENRQSLCEECHNRHKQRLETTGVLLGCDVSGMPLDENHHWNRKPTR